MTRLFEASYGQVAEFIKKLAVAGFTAEHLAELSKDPVRIRVWVDYLSNVTEDERTDAEVDEVFASDNHVRLLLRRQGFVALSDIAACCKRELAAVRGMGEKRFNEVKTVLAAHGYDLPSHQPGECTFIMREGGSELLARREAIGSAPLGRCLIRSWHHNARPDMKETYKMLTVDTVLARSEGALRGVLTPIGLSSLKNWRLENGL